MGDCQSAHLLLDTQKRQISVILTLFSTNMGMIQIILSSWNAQPVSPRYLSYHDFGGHIAGMIFDIFEQYASRED
jgi:hypothetical protein